jgi:tellurite resistance protein TerC
VNGENLLWAVFALLVAGILALDLGVFHRQAHAVRMKEALIWSAVWIALALLFDLAILLWLEDGRRHALEFLTCYLTEKALSVDNIFVFVVIFRYFGVPAESQHRVLFWGILGALAMRGAFIWLGVELIERFEWTTWLLGLFLLVTAVKLARESEHEVHPERNPLLRACRRLVPVTSDFVGQRFFVRQGGRTFATPLLFTLLVVETTDVLFAVDSVPAAIAITSDRFILYTSNVLAVLGLRALYFAIAGAMLSMRYLHLGLAAILAFVGLKMLIAPLWHVPIGLSLSVIAAILAISVIASLARGRKPPAGSP